MRILVLNLGSSSQKSRLYEFADRPAGEAVWEKQIEWDGEIGSHGRAVAQILEQVPSPETIDVVGHRVVHGGSRYGDPVRITQTVKADIARLADYAPLHNQAALEGIAEVERVLGVVPQVAVFDTAFHRHLPPAAAVYPGPYDWYTAGIKRFGFHGINHQYCAARAAELLGAEQSRRLVVCHLGNGCSLAAIRDGTSVDTTMGFTPLDGLMMGTRSGSVDPGILTYLLRRSALDAAQLDVVLNTQSGLLGISGVSGDMRAVLAARQAGHARATLAFDIYIHRLRGGIASMTASLGGLDALVFTAGVGEHAAEVREAACQGLAHLGVELVQSKNRGSQADAEIQSADSRVRVLIIRAQEDWMIAKACWGLLRDG
ncbi:MAG TPA: acetate kinase [Gemmatimonadales bacterium]|nr:acetate kinase [Gemmatimonadales bacterium]